MRDNEILELAAPFNQWQMPFAKVFSLEGEVYRHEKNRKTMRFKQEQDYFFVKMHRGVGWKEIFKNLFQLRLPVLGARQEWLALKRLKELDIPTMEVKGFGQRGCNPANLKSFLITKEITQVISLEEWTKIISLNQSKLFQIKLAIIKELARMARLLHVNGINHRDFYLCHFLLDRSTGLENLNPSSIKLYIIDLHRAQIRKKVPHRWLKKDLAGLYFSCLDLELTQRDVLRFLKYYNNLPLADVLRNNADFWQEIQRTANKLYKKVHGKEPVIKMV